MRKALVASLCLGLAVVACAATAGVAAGGVVTRSSERQRLPGLTERTIWSQNQVFVYRLPQNVTHTGDIHVELTYTPMDNDCFIYLLGPVAEGSSEWRVCPGTYRQGFLSLWPGREVIDYAVPEVLNDDPVDEGVRGDTYYVVVQAANATSRFRLSGYTPRAAPGSLDTTGDESFTRASWRTPAKARAWRTVRGAPYGGAFDIVPTSQGRVECRLEYPADPVTRTVAPATGSLPAAFEQYVYPTRWEDESGELPVDQPVEYSHWDLYGLNRHAAAPLAGDDWYGLQGAFTAQTAGPWKPGRPYHYVPVLWLASSQPYAVAPGAPAPPATGLRTVGYKATLLIPQNLRLSRAPKRVRRGARATLRGTLALPVAASPDAAVAWAPPGTRVWIQKKAGARWVTAKRVRVGANGAWKVVLSVRGTTRWRAFWPGSGEVGPESSLVKKTTVRGR